MRPNIVVKVAKALPLFSTSILSENRACRVDHKLVSNALMIVPGISQTQLLAIASRKGPRATRKPPKTTGFFFPTLSDRYPNRGWKIMLQKLEIILNSARVANEPPRWRM